MNKILTTILIFVIFSTVINAQNIIIEGVIKDSKQKEVLPFANVFLQKDYFGTVSNQNGEFKIITPQGNKNDSLSISYIGYKTQTISISNIKNPLEVFLKEDRVILNEIVVTGYTAESIINKAIDKTPSNYSSKPYTFKGFYRVTSQKDNSYIHLSEAAFDIYQAKINKPKQQFRLEKMRAIKDEKASKGIDLGLKPNGIYGFDIVNNLNEWGFLTKKAYKQYTFSLEGSVLIDGQEAYKITFDQKNSKKSGYKGYMLIDKETFAFVYL